MYESYLLIYAKKSTNFLVKESKKCGFTLKEMQGLLDGALPDKLKYIVKTN